MNEKVLMQGEALLRSSTSPADALKLIQDTAQEAQAAHILPELSGDGRKAFVQQGGEIKEFSLPPAPRRHVVHSLVDLILYARREDNKFPVVWHDDSGVALLTDDADRRDAVTFPLTPSERFETLAMLAEDKPTFDQAKFIRLLRVDLGLDNLKIVAKFRRLDWSLSDDGGGDVQHGANKVSKSVMAKVQGIDELPDELDVQVPVYQQTGERQTYIVKCAIEIDTLNRLLQLVPLPDELERVIDLAQASIHDRLTAALGEIDGQQVIPVYYGKP